MTPRTIRRVCSALIAELEPLEIVVGLPLSLSGARHGVDDRRARVRQVELRQAIRTSPSAWSTSASDGLGATRIARCRATREGLASRDRPGRRCYHPAERSRLRAHGGPTAGRADRPVTKAWDTCLTRPTGTTSSARTAWSRPVPRRSSRHRSSPSHSSSRRHACPTRSRSRRPRRQRLRPWPSSVPRARCRGRASSRPRAVSCGTMAAAVARRRHRGGKRSKRWIGWLIARHDGLRSDRRRRRLRVDQLRGQDPRGARLGAPERLHGLRQRCRGDRRHPGRRHRRRRRPGLSEATKVTMTFDADLQLPARASRRRASSPATTAAAADERRGGGHGAAGSGEQDHQLGDDPRGDGSGRRLRAASRPRSSSRSRTSRPRPPSSWRYGAPGRGAEHRGLPVPRDLRVRSGHHGARCAAASRDRVVSRGSTSWASRRRDRLTDA